MNEFIQKITSLEASLKVSKLKFFDFNPWPYIRLSILNKWNLEKSLKLEKKSEIAAKNKFKQFKNFTESFLAYIKNPISNSGYDIVYFTQYSCNQNADAFDFCFSNQYKIKKIEMGDQVWRDQRLEGKNITFLHFILKVTRLKCRLLSYIKPTAYFPYEDLNHEINKVFGFHTNFVSDLLFINAMADRFVKILKSYKPKLVFLECFYSSQATSVSLACHRLGIRAVEYQHGAQNDDHAMYTHWNNIPDSGYELIPDIFWMWGKVSKERIEKWSKTTTKHEAIVGGNIWMTYYRREIIGATDLSQYYKSNRINILVSLQGDSYFPSFLLDSIKSFPSNFIWHFRDHPRVPVSEGLKEKISSLPNTEINFSSEACLYDLLKLTNLHITASSTVAFEAQSFNVPTIFTHARGHRTLMSKNGLYCAESLDEINVLIERILQNKEKIMPDYIISDLDTHCRALSRLMEQS